MRSLYFGVDIGSTTLKIVVLDNNKRIINSIYERHFSDIKNCFIRHIKKLLNLYRDSSISITITGSSGISISEALDIPFLQEVIASTKSIETFNKETDVVIELGGEDAKITFLTNGLDQRMNGTCAGGTGSFIDQMASLLDTDTLGLNELAKGYENIYPIAARCGVFAKTDIQPLINEGARKEDIAVSIFQAVVIQTISGLACGREIKGNVAFLGGPLYFLSELRNRFIETLNLRDNQIVFPENSQLYIALGAALYSMDYKCIDSNEYIERIDNIKEFESKDSGGLLPLFKNDNEYIEFKERHLKADVGVLDISSFSGRCYLGIDAGSTTTKAALIDDNGNLLYTYYGGNGGSPLESTLNILRDIYSNENLKENIVYSAVTGYGEGLIKSALKIDIGEIETIAHYTSAKFFNPNVDFILDIGGQDMKCMKIKNGVIDNIILNEACSSGCGSFLESFANSLDIKIEDFANMACLAKAPVDLGSRCTVFMNSKVKQVQKEGASIADIAAGLCYSVIKNALYKVIKIRKEDDIGDNIVVQGGTFYNDAVLRSMELLIGKNIIRPKISGIMGAFGAALIAKENYSSNKVSTLIKNNEIDGLNWKMLHSRCNSCNNKCKLSISSFTNGGRYISGNRCEKPTGKTHNHKIPNMYNYKYKRIFDYKPLNDELAFRGEIGIPRVLNIYENYPFWHTFFENLGFKVVLSSHSSKKIYEKGIETIPSESVCYPGKLVHGHIKDLLEKGVKRIFYPCIPNEIMENKNSDNNFNCPIVTSYPEVIDANFDDINTIEFMKPFLPFNNRGRLEKRLYDEFKGFGITKSEVKIAFNLACSEYERVKEDIKQEGERVLKFIEENEIKGIVLSGRPYHIDPEINHGIPEIITSLNMAVITEDAVCHLAETNRPLRVVDQWVYHSRLYSASEFVAAKENLEIVQLNSFGCGLDAVTTDQVQEILENKNKVYTMIKIDEGSNLGAVKIRLRSLKAAMKERDNNNIKPTKGIQIEKRIPFTKEMKKTHTILCPQMSPIHFELGEEALKIAGYNLKVLPSTDSESIEEGLKYVNNDVCYPAIITLGQILKALKSGEYDLSTTAVAITQTGGGCRATNYIGFLRKALKDAGYDNIPVISVNTKGMEKNPGFSLTPSLIVKLGMAIIYGDALMKTLYRVRPYEYEEGSANSLYEKWISVFKESLKETSIRGFNKNIKLMFEDFDNLKLRDIKKPRVGLVGEILVKYHPTANNNIIDLLEDEGAEVVVPDLLDFFLYCLYESDFKRKYLDGSLASNLTSKASIKLINAFRGSYIKAAKKSKRFIPPKDIEDIAHGASNILSLGHCTGEGWFLTGEMVELLEEGVNNIVCMQPFACLPNHVTGKGVIKKLKQNYKNANIAAIDYDPGASYVNQVNRIKLMLNKAFDDIKRP
ncbi:MAG: acyl-CoA dehydratase activase-related protein [Clostridium sp.]